MLSETLCNTFAAYIHENPARKVELDAIVRRLYETFPLDIDSVEYVLKATEVRKIIAKHEPDFDGVITAEHAKRMLPAIYAASMSGQGELNWLPIEAVTEAMWRSVRKPGPREFDFIKEGTTVYLVHAKCADRPVFPCTVEFAYDSEQCADLWDKEGRLGDISADYENIFATKAEATAVARSCGLLDEENF